MPFDPNPAMQRVCDALSKSQSLTQLREHRLTLAREFVCNAANARPTWQQSVDVALNRTVIAHARVLALGALVQYFPDQCALILLRVVTTRGDNIAVRMVAGQMLASSAAVTAEHALLRAINDNATDQAISLIVAQISKLNDAGVPNNLRQMMCKEAQDSAPGRRALRRIWRAPDQFGNGWNAVAITLLLSDSSEALFVDAANMASIPAYGKPARLQILQMLYTLGKQRSGVARFSDPFWTAIRQVWANESGDLRYVAGELLKLQGGRQG